MPRIIQSFRLTPETEALLRDLAKQHKADKTAIVEAALHAFSKLVEERRSAEIARLAEPGYRDGPEAILAALRERGPMTRADAAEVAGLDTRAASMALMRLARRGVVVRPAQHGGTWALAPPPKPGGKTKRP
jgi:predicted transcriptional regulator